MEPTAPVTAPAAPEKKSWFETVVTSTPVLLTVIATFMVGQSTGEMTRAQYYRSLASQNQSKVGDQWGFFQAKRIRGQILDGNADLLMAQKRDPFSRDTFIDAAEGMVKEVRALDKQADDSLAKGLKSLRTEAEAALADAKVALNPPDGGWQGEKHRLDPKNVQAALDALKPTPPKKIKGAKSDKAPKESAEANLPGDAEQTRLLQEIIGEIKQRKAEGEVFTRAIKLSDETISLAIKEADARAEEVYRRGKAIENVLEEFDALADRQTALAAEFLRLTARKRAESEGNKELERRADAVRAMTAKLHGDYNAARHAFSSRRYEEDARSNQDSAYLYEVRVYLSSARSDKHLFRSKMFLFAMLVAQVGVTIATLAMAVRQKSVFWLLAALTGIIAIGFGTYVYLDLGPIPML